LAGKKKSEGAGENEHHAKRLHSGRAAPKCTKIRRQDEATSEHEAGDRGCRVGHLQKQNPQRKQYTLGKQVSAAVSLPLSSQNSYDLP
jgi:hypothetical protein